jgi:hypothetical protein
MEEELEKQIQADIEKYNSLRESGATMSEAFTEATKSEEQIINEKIEDIKDNLIERINDRNEDFDFEVKQFTTDEGYGFGGGVNDSAINEDLDKFIQEYKEATNELRDQLNVISNLDTLEDKQMFLDIYKEEGIEKAVEQFTETTNGKSFEEAADMEKVLFNNAVEAIENAGYDKSAEGNAIDVVQEVATAGYDIEDSKLTDLVNEKFGTDLSESDINSIKEVAGKEMNGEIESMDHSKDLNMNDIKEINSQEISVQGDHASIKEDTMAGVESERVVDRETALNEMDKAPGVDSDKVETKEESAQRDSLTAEDQKILDSFGKESATLNDAVEAFNSSPKNAETSESEGQKSSEVAKQK